MQSQTPSLFSRLLFLWVTPFIHRNAAVPLTEAGLIELPAGLRSDSETAQFLSNWTARAERRFGLHRALLYTFRRQLLIAFAISMVLLVTSLLGPVILRDLIKSLSGTESQIAGWILAAAGIQPMGSTTTASIVLALLLFLNTTVIILSIHHLFFVQLDLALRTKLALTGAIYRKSLLARRDQRAGTPSGYIINLVAIDAIKVHWFFNLVHTIWFHPLQIAGTIYLLYRFVGPPALTGAGVLVAILGLCGVIARRQTAIRTEQIKLSDRRVGLMNETLTHIKAVKSYAWEEQLKAKVSAIRDDEVRSSERIVLTGAISTFLTTSAPALAMLVTFTELVLRGGTFDPAIAFPTLALIMNLRFALGVLPDTLFNIVETHVAVNRLENFFKLNEWARPDAVRRGDRSPSSNHSEEPERSPASNAAPIEISNARFDWDADHPALRVDTFRAQAGELIAVVGSVGSGKSALLLGILNEIQLARGIVRTDGRIAYVAQQPWIMSETVKENILCGAPFDPTRFDRCISASALIDDLPQLPKGIDTQIGERGVNLSGGQRQRVALARALYAQAEIYLLDDPLSALDPAVANKVFDALILNDLGATARVLVTHRLEYALRADRVAVIEAGRVCEYGPPAELLEVQSRFRELFGFHTEAHGHSLLSAEPPPPAASPTIDLLEEPAETADMGGSPTIEKEDRAIGSVDRNITWDYLKRFVPRWSAVLLVGLFAGRQLAAVAADLWLARFSSGTGYSIPLFIGGYSALVIVLCVLNFWRSYYLLRRGLAAGTSAHRELLDGVLRAPLRFFEANPVGRILNRFSRDLETIDWMLPRSILDAISSLFDILSVMLTVAIIQPINILVIAPVFAVYVKLQRLFRPTSRELQRLDSVTRSPVFGQLSESLNGTETIRGFGLIEEFCRRYARHLDLNGRAFHSIVCANRWLGVRLEFLGAIIVLAVGLVAALMVDSRFGAALSGFTLTYVTGVTGAMNWLVRMTAQTESHLTSFERISTYAALKPERWSGSLPPPSWPSHGEISFHNLTLRYRAELPPALTSLSCRIEPGKRIGIVGRTGSGKSTVVLGLLRLLEPAGGSIEIDGIDTSTLDLHRLRSALTVIPQEPVLFSGSIRDNLDPFGQYSDDDLDDALRRVEMRAAIAALPKGINSLIQESGGNISLGQRQLLCLARALLKCSKIIIMDEATAHIDVETDVAIQKTIRREFAAVTVLVIAHRLGTIMDSDQVLVLNQGRLAEYGAPADLLTKSDGVFRALVHEVRMGQQI